MARRAIPADPSIGERIRDRRELRGWSLRHAAGRAGIAHTTWARIERGELRTDRYLIADLAAALECPTADLTGRPHIPADRALEQAQARVEPLWRALLEIAPDEPADRPAPAPAALAARVELVDARRAASDYAALGQLLPDLLLDLHAATAGPDPATALTWLVDACHTARGMLRALGRLAEATMAAERCRQAAERLDDPVSLAVADWARANAAAGSGSYRRALTLTTRAVDDLLPHLAADGALPMLGMLHLSAAHAELRAHPDDAMGHLAEAAAIASRTGEVHRWWMWWGPTNVAVWRMGALVDAGQPAVAVREAAAVQPALVPSADRQATYHLELARALTDVGRRDDDAVRHLLVAERLAPQRIRAYTAARETARFLRARAGGPALAGLCERMAVQTGGA